ncbi:MAG: aminopeptidase P family protein [Acidobacteria bacterium]|nr:aminopeptidase P family protein [Acidobacteriota bacterium]
MLIKEKVEQAKKLLAEFDVDCWITFVRESAINGDPTLVYLAPGHVTWHSAFVVARDGRTRAIVGRYDVQAIADLGVWDDVTGFVTGIREPLAALLRELDPRTIAVNYSESSEIADGITHGMYLTLMRILGELSMADRVVSAEPIVSALRERKTAAEIDVMREAIRHTQEIYALVGGFIRPGVTESEIAAFVHAEIARRGLGHAWEEATCPAVFTGPGGAEAHYAPGARQVERGHVLNMDFGVKVGAYVSDMQRTFYVLAEGETAAPAEVRKGFDTIVAAIEAAKRAMRPGVEGRAIDAVARGLIVGAGYEEYPHALGHQVGRFAHDGTALLGPTWEKYADKPLKKLQPGMVFTLEPRLTVAGRGICTVEEMVVVTETGCEWLSDPQRELVLIR